MALVTVPRHYAAGLRLFDTQLTICLIRSVWVAVQWAGSAVRGPAGVGNANVNVKLHIQVDILLF